MLFVCLLVGDITLADLVLNSCFCLLSTALQSFCIHSLLRIDLCDAFLVLSASGGDSVTSAHLIKSWLSVFIKKVFVKGLWIMTVHFLYNNITKI